MNPIDDKYILAPYRFVDPSAVSWCHPIAKFKAWHRKRAWMASGKALEKEVAAACIRKGIN